MPPLQTADTWLVVVFCQAMVSAADPKILYIIVDTYAFRFSNEIIVDTDAFPLSNGFFCGPVSSYKSFICLPYCCVKTGK
jgi:hypothetical protein